MYSVKDFALETETEARETIITFNEKEKDAIVYTASFVTASKIMKYVDEFPEVYKIHKIYKNNENKITGIEFSFPKKYALPAKPHKSRPMTEEQKKAAAERLAKIRQNRKKEQ